MNSVTEEFATDPACVLLGSRKARSPKAGSQVHKRNTSIMPIRSATVPKPTAASPPKPKASPRNSPPA
jgi:hypothetical protein